MSQGKNMIQSVYINEATRWITRQKAQQEAEEPTMPLAEQEFRIGGVVFKEGTDKTPIDACAIQRYNGASRWVIYWRNKTPERSGAWCVRESSSTYINAVMEKFNE